MDVGKGVMIHVGGIAGRRDWNRCTWASIMSGMKVWWWLGTWALIWIHFWRNTGTGFDKLHEDWSGFALIGSNSSEGLYYSTLVQIQYIISQQKAILHIKKGRKLRGSYIRESKYKWFGILASVIRQTAHRCWRRTWRVQMTCYQSKKEVNAFLISVKL